MSSTSCFFFWGEFLSLVVLSRKEKKKEKKEQPKQTKTKHKTKRKKPKKNKNTKQDNQKNPLAPGCVLVCLLKETKSQNKKERKTYMVQDTV